MNRSTRKTVPDIVIVQKVCDFEGRGLNAYLRDGRPDEQKTGGKAAKMPSVRTQIQRHLDVFVLPQRG
jgi:hypothetical protein